MNIGKLACALIASVTIAACSSYGTRPSAPAMASASVLTGANGMTLYTFDKDMAGSGKSVCNGACATNWPPLLVMDGEASDKTAGGDYSIVTRDDGKKQWAFKGMPLYYWIKDKNPGDRTGDGVNKVWHVAKP
jgi:predicted lipoprotein with Yx(FWY)xxD motif